MTLNELKIAMAKKDSSLLRTPVWNVPCQVTSYNPDNDRVTVRRLTDNDEQVIPFARFVHGVRGDLARQINNLPASRRGNAVVVLD
jgi:hypothetical protein